MRSSLFCVAPLVVLLTTIIGCSETPTTPPDGGPTPGDGPAADGPVVPPTDGPLPGRLDGGGDGGPGDQGPLTPDGPPHDLDKIEVEGKVTLEFGSPATGVEITARCGAKKEVTATSDDQGRYSFVADVKDCSPLVIEFNKESFLPNFRVLHLPPPTSPVTVDVPLAGLGKLQCGDHRCVLDNRPDWKLPSSPMRQGWATTIAGASALDFYAGELRQTDGKLLSLVGLAYFDFRDQGGNKLTTLQKPFVNCVPVPSEALDWLGDVELSTDVAKMRWFGFEPKTGRWKPHPDLAVVSMTKGNQFTIKEGLCEFVTTPDGKTLRKIEGVLRSELDDVRAQQATYYDECFKTNQVATEIWVCGKIYGSGWFAWGIDMPKRNCFALKARDKCGTPLKNVVFSIKGRDHGYRAEVWSDYKGEACVEVIPSEPAGSDYDADTLGGETFWIDVDVSWAAGGAENIAAHKIGKPKANSSCAQPSSCETLEQVFSDFAKGC